MKTLYPKQEHAKRVLLAALDTYGAALDASETGLGKTIVACHVTAETGRPVGVIAPKIVLPAWERELRDAGVEPLFVLNYEKIRNGRTRWLGKKHKRVYKWDLPPSTMLVVDEVHKCKAHTGQNSSLHMAATRQGIPTLNLSATAAIAAPDMRALGFALGLHNDLQSLPGKPSFETWLKKHGSWKDPWRKWRPGGKKHLLKIHEAIFGGEVPRGVRLTVADMPEAFKGNLILDEPIDFGPAMRKAYDEALDCVSIEASDYKHLDEEQLASAAVLIEMMAARQTAEKLKVPFIVDMVSDLLDEDKSIAIFVNFQETVDLLLEQLPGASVIRGGQTAEEREREVQAFQADQSRIMIANIAAGGAGVSLHDIHGNHPRVSLISPSFNLIDLVQTMGRVYRNGMKTPCVQRLLIAEGTIEEGVAEALRAKRKNLDALLDGV